MATTQAVTLGESLAHRSRTDKWMMAVFLQIYCPVGLTLSLIYYTISVGLSPSSAPWRLPLLLSYGAYLSVLLAINSYAELFLPRTPATLMEKLRNIGGGGVGLGVLTVMVIVVFATAVEDACVLACCTFAVVVFIAGLVAFWVWLARTYGDTALESSTAPAMLGQQPRRVQNDLECGTFGKDLEGGLNGV